MRKRTIERALKAVNKARVVLGHEELTEMPEGEEGQASNCPIYHAIPALESVGPEGANVALDKPHHAVILRTAWKTHPHQKSWRVRLPVSIRNFITEFDTGRAV